MAWIESHTVLSRHRKLAEFALGLRLRRSYAMGHLHSLWHAALEQQEDGDLSSWSDEFIAESSDYPGDAPQFVRLLQKHRWLDGRLLHDWIDYAGFFLIKKYSTSNRQKLVEIWRKHGREYGANGKRTDSEPRESPPDSTAPNQTKPKKSVAVAEGDLRARDSGNTSASADTAPSLAKLERRQATQDRGPQAATATRKPGADAKPKPPAMTGVPGTNKPTIQSALDYFAWLSQTTDERFVAEEIKESYREFEAACDLAGNWKWGKRDVGDWRAAMISRMMNNREKRHGKRPAINAADALVRAINGVRVVQSQLEND